MNLDATRGGDADRGVILVVDDAADARMMYSIYLSHKGFRVIEAADGESAIHMAAEHLPRLVLMDLGLPRVDGWEATRRIKADPRTCGIRVLALTGHAYADSVERAKDAGVDAFFIKPCLPMTVFAKIQELLHFQA